MITVDTYKSLEELRDAMPERQNVMTVPMWVLRNAHGAGRIGIHVKMNISRQLHGLGLEHYPSDLPDSQDDYVRVYKQGTRVAAIYAAMLNPNPSRDQLLREAASGAADEILAAVRELVCQT